MFYKFRYRMFVMTQKLSLFVLADGRYKAGFIDAIQQYSNTHLSL